MARFSGFAEVEAALAALSSGASVSGGWSLARALHHCAFSVESSIGGFPKLKPVLVRRLVGPLVLSRFIQAGQMRHGLSAPLDGEPPPPDDAVAHAVERLRAAIAAFRAAEQLHEHPVYGRVSKPDFERAHAMHVADHLTPRDA
jgi:hypothetical protein